MEMIIIDITSAAEGTRYSFDLIPREWCSISVGYYRTNWPLLSYTWGGFYFNSAA